MKILVYSLALFLASIARSSASPGGNGDYPASSSSSSSNTSNDCLLVQLLQQQPMECELRLSIIDYPDDVDVQVWYCDLTPEAIQNIKYKIN